MPDRRPVHSRLLRILDVVVVVAALLSINIFFTGGFREWTPLGRLSLTSWERPLIAAAILAAIRQWFWPRPTIVARTSDGLRRLWATTGVRQALPVVLSTRTGVFVAGFLGIALFGYRESVGVPWRIYENEILNLPARWDTGWYLGVAIDGYMWTPTRDLIQQNITFFPVYPMLMRYGSLLLGRETMWTGVLISWLSFFGALVYLYRLTMERVREDAAPIAIALLACYPFAFFYSTAYTESLFLLTMVGACYHLERDELWKASFWGLLAGLTRPNGCLLSVVLALIAMRPMWPHGWRSLRPTVPPAGGWPRLADRIAAAAAPGIGMLIYSTYIFFLTGNPLQWAAQNAAWGRVYRGLGALVTQQSQTIGEHGLYDYAATRTLDAVQLAAVLFVLCTIVPIARRVGLPYAVMVLVNTITPLLMGGLLSMGRVSSVLFPVFMWLGTAIPPTHRTSWLAVFAMLQALLAAVFFTWRPLY
jgi:mannosyltransferase PIG-V